jgi:hypothetical protein
MDCTRLVLVLHMLLLLVVVVLLPARGRMLTRRNSTLF